MYKTESAKAADYRLSREDTKRINEDYLGAVRYSREAHRAVAELAGKVPHCHGIFVGGTTTNIDIPQIENIKYSIKVIKSFIVDKLIPDVYTIAATYEDYFKIGDGYKNFMSYGLYDNYLHPIKMVSTGVMINGIREEFQSSNIAEDISKTWVESDLQTLIPGEDNKITYNPYKPEAYSWVNAPRYKGNPMEVGALARMTLSGGYSGGVSIMDRIIAKSIEAKRLCEAIEGLIDLLKLKKAYQEQWEIPEESRGVGLIEAERGSLGHWLSIKNKLVHHYTLIPPSSWNLSPTDNRGIKGPVEEALIGTEIKDMVHPVEVGRIVRSFDPCLNCAAHVTSDKYEPITINIL